MDAIGGTREGKAGTWLIGIFSIAGILACVGDLVMTHLLGTWFPGYRPFFQPMSDLGEGASPVASITSTWWVIMGLLFVVFGYGYHRAFPDQGKAGVIAGWMIALYGVGEGLGSGLVHGVPGEIFRTLGSIVHNLLGAAGVGGAIVLPFIIMKVYDGRFRSCLYWYSWFTTITGIFFIVLFLISSVYRPEGSWISYTGLWQRLFMLIYYLFYICLAVLMLSRGKSPSREPSPRS